MLEAAERTVAHTDGRDAGEITHEMGEVLRQDLFKALP